MSFSSILISSFQREEHDMIILRLGYEWHWSNRGALTLVASKKELEAS